MPIKLNNLTSTFTQIGREQNKGRQTSETSSAATQSGVPRPNAAEVELARSAVEGRPDVSRQLSPHSDVESAAGGVAGLVAMLQEDPGLAVRASAEGLSKNAASLLS